MHNLLQQSRFWGRGRLSLQTKGVKSFLGPDDSSRDTSKCSQRQSCCSDRNPGVF